MTINKKRGAITLLVILAVLALLLIPRLLPEEKAASPQAAGPRMAQAIPVDVKVIEPEQLSNTIFANGSVLGNESVEIVTETPGKITKIHFREGQHVSKGELLVEINNADLLAQKRKAEIEIELAESREFRQRKLLEREGISEDAYDEALNQLNRLKAELEFINAQIAKTEIRAPFNGAIGLRSVSEGSYITPSTRIATLQSYDPVKIDFSIPQKYYQIVEKGKKVLMRKPGEEKAFEARIYAIEPEIDEVSRMFRVRALAPNENRQLVPGAYIEISIVLDEIDEAYLIPTEALIPDVQGHMVFTVKNGQATPRRVEAGIRTEKEVQLLDGVQTGDSVIVSAIIQLRPGAAINVSRVVN